MLKKWWTQITQWFLGEYLVKVQDGFQRARIRLTYNFAFFYVLLGTLLLYQYWIEGRFFQLGVTLFLILLFGGIPFLLRKTHQLNGAALLFGFGGVIQMALSHYFAHGAFTMETGIWGAVNVLYIYFVLGNRWGAGFLGLFATHIFAFWVLNQTSYDYPGAEGFEDALQDSALLIHFIPLAFLFYLIREYWHQGKKAEQELQFALTMETTLNRELEAQLELLSKQEDDLRKAKLAAEQHARSRTDFLSNMSHEIRTPMNGVVGIANVLLEETPKPEQRENLEILKFSAENLLSLIDNILDFNKLESGRLELDVRPFELPEVLQRSVALWFPNAQRKNIDLNLELDPVLPSWVVSDPFKLTQIVNNLLNNAIRFTDKGGVTLAARLIEDTGHHVKVEVCVSDTGVGISEEEQESIFETFFQATNNPDSERGGSGLGLAIVKKLTRLFSAPLSVESSVGEGTTFKMLYYFGKAAAPPKVAAAIRQSNSLEGKKVLLVEDNVTNRLVARKILSRWKVIVDEAENGKFAIETLNEDTSYDLILMDLQMPVMDGYETAEWIRNQENAYFQKVPIIALTAAALPAVRERILQIGVNDFVTKPFDPQELKEKVIQLIFAG